MGVKVASLYAEIGADTTKLEAGLKRTHTELDKTAGKAKGFGAGLSNALGMAAKGFATAGAAVAVFAGTWDKAMDFGKAGAELAYAQSKFDNLSGAIGTTASALKDDLRGATKGLVSDAELVASAGDFMALGLAKTHDEVVRLTRVAGALGMDMNQLVLTLTNQTTMRFDALGVSVDGFDAKVKALKNSGMSASDAFKEAFLQQAEQQIAVVGDKADSSAAAFLRLETATKNLGDALKMQLAPSLATAATAATTLITAVDKVNTAMGEHNNNTALTASSYEAYVAEMKRAASVTNNVIDANGNLVTRRGKLIEQNFLLTEGEYEGARATAAWNSEQREAMRVTEGAAAGAKAAGDAVEQAADQADNANTKWSNLAPQFREVAEASREAATNAGTMAAATAELAGAQQSLNEAQANWKQDIGNDLGSMLANAGLKQDTYMKALAATDEVTGTSLKPAQDLKNAQQDLIDELERTNDVDAYRKGLQELQETFMPLNGSIETATDLVDTLYQKLLLLERGYYATVTIIEKNGGSFDFTGVPEDRGGSKVGGEVFGASGLDFIVPPGYPNDSYRVNVQSGEHVTVTPAGQTAGAGSRNVTYNIFSVEKPGRISNALRISELMGGAA